MKRFQIIYPLVGLACWLGTLFLAGCSDDTGSLPDQTTEAERIPVTISIGVDDAEDLFTRAEGDDTGDGEDTGEEGGTTPENPDPDPEPNPDPEEPTIPTHTATPFEGDDKVGNDLVVYIMGRDNYTLTYEDFTYEETAHRYVAELPLYRGTYQAYAFANHTGLSLTLPGDIANTPAVDAISLVSEDNGIPMSGEAEWEVNGAGEYEVELVRMVGRMDITITDERGEDSEDGNVESVEISNLLPARTNLLRAGFGEVTLPASVTDLATWTWPSFALDDEKKAETSFYLHETEAQEYHLTVSFDEGDNRDVSLARNMIPRNHYFPLYIHIRDYALVLTIQTEVPPIGGIATPNKEQGSYDIQLPEGCTFSIEAQFKKNGQIVNEARSWSYELGNTTDNRILFEQTSGSANATSITLSGKATAQSFGEEIVNTMHITVVDPENGKEIPFELNFYIRALSDNENSTTTTRSASAEVQPVIVEL